MGGGSISGEGSVVISSGSMPRRSHSRYCAVSIKLYSSPKLGLSIKSEILILVVAAKGAIIGSIWQIKAHHSSFNFTSFKKAFVILYKALTLETVNSHPHEMVFTTENQVTELHQLTMPGGDG